jgi:hypothetical protein
MNENSSKDINPKFKDGSYERRAIRDGKSVEFIGRQLGFVRLHTYVHGRVKIEKNNVNTTYERNIKGEDSTCIQEYNTYTTNFDEINYEPPSSSKEMNDIY